MKKKRKEWLPFIEIYFELWRFDEWTIKELKQRMSGRRVGRPKGLDFTDAKSAWLKSQLEHIRENTWEELSDWAWPEFYLQCTGYRKGGAELLKWCQQHLRSKNSTKEWGFALDKDNITYLASVLENPMFLKKEEFVHGGHKYLDVEGKKVFSNPFSYILERAWVWNVAMEYSVDTCKKLGIKGATLLALRSAFYNIEPQRDQKTLVSFIAKEQNLKHVSGVDTATKQIQRAKAMISKRIK
jgi:hypothetical protein